jgi:putative regulator of septum formation
LNYAPFECASRHAAEAYFVGELTGKAADRTANKTGAAASAAAAECGRRAVPFFGAAHRTGRLRVQPVLPGTAGWLSGARWFRCDALEADLNTDRVISRTGSLRDALKGAAKLALRCFQPTVRGADVGDMKAVDCAKGHDAEFAGLWTAPDIKLEDLNGDQRMAKGCRSVIARWAKLPDNGDVRYRYGYLAFAPTLPEWRNGVRSVQCFLWIEGRTMKGSYRNAGAGKLPINYG